MSWKIVVGTVNEYWYKKEGTETRRYLYDYDHLLLTAHPIAVCLLYFKVKFNHSCVIKRINIIIYSTYK